MRDSIVKKNSVSQNKILYFLESIPGQHVQMGQDGQVLTNNA